MDTSTNSSILTLIKKNLQIRKSITNKILESGDKTKSSLFNRKNLKSKFSETKHKPTTLLNKSEDFYFEKKIKYNVNEILNPYKQKQNEIIHKNALKNLSLSKSKLKKYEIQNIFKRGDESNRSNKSTISNISNTLPSIKTNYSVNNIKQKLNRSLKHNSVISELSKSNVNLRKMPIVKSGSLSINFEKNLLKNLQNKNLKELIL